MTDYRAAPSLIQLERTYEATPEQVFFAWADRDALLDWGSPGPGWNITMEAFEFEVGGRQVTRFSPGNDSEIFLDESRFHDIVPFERIVSSGSMSRDGYPLFVGVLTIEFADNGTGCALRLTEQGVFLDGRDQRENHEHGWKLMLDKLGSVAAVSVDS